MLDEQSARLQQDVAHSPQAQLSRQVQRGLAQLVGHLTAGAVLEQLQDALQPTIPGSVVQGRVACMK